LNPNVELQAGKTYTAKVQGGSVGVKDSVGNPLVADKVWSFTTLPPPLPTDTTAPKVTSTSPKHTATGVASSNTLIATFSEKMDPASITNSTFKLLKLNPDGSTTQVTNVTVSLSTDGLVGTLNPFETSTTLLEQSTTYRAVVTTGARDEAGNQLDQNTTTTGLQQKAWYFTVSP
jgi:Bacterial Ig-like domain